MNQKMCCQCGKPADGDKEEATGKAFCARHSLAVVRRMWEGPLGHCWDLGFVSFGRHGLPQRQVLANPGSLAKGRHIASRGLTDSVGRS